MPRRRGNLHVLHYAVDGLQNAIYLGGNFVGGASRDLVTADGGLQTESLFRAPQQKKTKQNKSRGENWCEIESPTHGHAHRSHNEDSCRRGESGDHFVASMQDATRPNKANSRDNLRRNASVISDLLDGECVRKLRVHRCAKTDKKIRTQSGWPML